MTQEDYCSYEIAKLLKEKGFEGDILMFIDKDNVKYDYTLSGFISDETIPCPTHQMEKEKALQILKEIHDNGIFSVKTALETLIPELAESEDERIRKWLICGMNALKEQKTETFATIPIDDAIAWLEKQGELKSSKWAEGDVVRHGGILALVTNGRKAMKSNREQITIQYPDEWVKAETKERKYFFDELEKQGKNLSCGMDVVPPEPSTSTVVTGSKGKQGEQNPADKCIGCNNVKGCVTCVDGSEWAHIIELNPAWSEDDNHEYFSDLLEKDDCDNIDDYAYQCAYCMSHDWLKENATWDDVETAVKLGAEWNDKHHKPAWSEEDETHINGIIDYLCDYKLLVNEEDMNVANGVQEEIDWLKSLNP